jgi:hypothetical protein
MKNALEELGIKQFDEIIIGSKPLRRAATSIVSEIDGWYNFDLFDFETDS